MNYENSKNLKIVMTFKDSPDSAISQRALELVFGVTHQEGVNSPIKKLSTEDSLTRKIGISKGLLINVAP